jgi:hypothetical protein
MALTEMSDNRELKLVTLQVARPVCVRYRYVCLMSQCNSLLQFTIAATYCNKQDNS